MATLAPERHRLHSLVVSDVSDIGEDAIAVELEVPGGLEPAFEFLPGQHVALSSPEVDGVRRNYSICSPAGGPLRVGIRVLPEGVFSHYVQREIRPGSTLDVLPPAGRFVTNIDPAQRRHVVALAAGSGITPVYSILASVLDGEPGSRCTLVYGNRTTASMMLLEDVADLKDRHPDRFSVFHVLSRESRGMDLLEGRIDAERLQRLAELIVPGSVSDWFVCGPLPMIEESVSTLAGLGVPGARIHRELFHADGVAPAGAPRRSRPGAEVSMILDGRAATFTMTPEDDSILDAALAVRPDAPYACKGGVCGTCRCRLVEGTVEMAQRYALEDDELAAGVRLACQSVPTSDRVVVDFDAV